ncbi:hypothetical protein MalM25_32040 [Planctomycetes bacterium MalM25]|nr:hypothetical protein MalM25_32040 [Planctomycetes bacterium MalM25]
MRLGWPLLVLALACGAPALAAWPPPRALDPDRLAAAGLRVVESEHATLVTDAPASPEVDGLPRLIELALPQWRERFDASPDEAWRLRVYLIEDEAKFRSLGLWPVKSSDFQHGLSLGYEVWVRAQTTDYYRRHLLLHEATHSFMATRLGSCGPGWYMEGMAELCGTHAWDGRRLQLATAPATRVAAPDWGRVRLVRDAIDDDRLLSVEAVRKIDNRVVLPTESYAWVWALCHFLDKHPAYAERFRKAPAWVNSPQFERRFTRMYAKDRERLEQEWRLFVTTLQYGHDLQREAIAFESQGASTEGGSPRIELKVDRGWQATGLRVEPGREYRIAALGRFVIGRDPDGAPWPCEAGGITLEYHDGRPLGLLLAAIDAGPGAFTRPIEIGSRGVLRPESAGELFLRVNDSPNRLSDNTGELTVRIHKN